MLKPEQAERNTSIALCPEALHTTVYLVYQGLKALNSLVLGVLGAPNLSLFFHLAREP